VTRNRQRGDAHPTLRDISTNRVKGGENASKMVLLSRNEKAYWGGGGWGGWGVGGGGGGGGGCVGGGGGGGV